MISRRLPQRSLSRLRVGRHAGCLSAAAYAAWLAFTPAPALAAPAWLSPVDVSIAPLTSQPVKPALGVDAAGDVIAVWGDLGPTGDRATVWAAVRPAGGPWQPPVAVYSADDPAQLAGFDLAVDPQGDALAVWEVFQCTLGPTVVCNYLPVQAAGGSAVTGAWQAPVTLGEASSSDAAGYAGPAPHVGLDAADDAIVAWDHWDGTNYEVRAARRIGATETWTAPLTISDDSYVPQPPDLAVDSAGDAIAAFGSYAASLPVGAAAWTAPVDVTSDTSSIAQVAIDGRGDATAVWIGSHLDESDKVHWLTDVATKPAGGDWQAPVALSDGQTLTSDPRIAVDASGDAAVVWESNLSGDVVVDARTRSTATGGWYPVTEVSPSAEAYQSPDVIVDGAGDAVALWQQHSGGDDSDLTMQAAIHPASPAGLAWQPPATLSSALPTPGGLAKVTAVAADPQGDVIAAWDDGDAIQAAVYDDAGPRLDDVSIPATGTAGQPLSFSASPFDLWSAPVATNWSFGDDSSAVGATVAHAFGAAGSYRVTVTGADALGNATSASGTVTIAPAASSGEPSRAPAAGSGEPSRAPAASGGEPSRAPVIERLAQSHRRWREGRKLAVLTRQAKGAGAGKRRRHEGPERATSTRRNRLSRAVLQRRREPPVGTVFSFTLDQQARVSLAFTQRLAGRRLGARCVVRTRRNRDRRACTRTVRSGTLTFRQAGAGASALSFQGRLSRIRRLAAGRYVVRLTATNAAGQRSRTRSLSFTVVKA